MRVTAYIAYRLDWKRNPVRAADRGNLEGFPPWEALAAARIEGPRHSGIHDGAEVIVLCVTGGDGVSLRADMPAKYACGTLTAREALAAVQAAHPKEALSVDRGGLVVGWADALP